VTPVLPDSKEAPGKTGAVKMRSVSIKLAEDLLARVDEAAGDESRSEWVRDAILGRLEPSRAQRTVPVVPTGCAHKTERKLSWGTLCADCGVRLR
jgi:hypothetical protein